MAKQSTGRKSTSKHSQLGRKKNTFTTKSGQTIKLNRSLGEKIKARRDNRAVKKAQRLAGMPKSRVKRFVYRLHPKRLYKYWFSREGAIMALKILGIGIIVGFLMLVGLFAYFRKDLPNLKDISGNNLGGSNRYYDRTGQTLLWEDFDAVKRIPVKDDEISQYVKDATVAIEDKDFFKHGGFDVRGISRAAVKNVTGGGDSREGGSTITQQLVRLTQKGVGNEQTYQRKLKEIILSIELERSYNKNEILVGYLNSAPYGNVQYGVESSTRDYFQKSAKDLTLDEAAFLAAIPKSPSVLSPYGPRYSPEALVGRQHYILDLMVEQGMISSEQRDQAKKVDTLAKVKEVKPKFEGIKAPYFVLLAKQQLEEKYSTETVNRGGWKVTTSLDMNLQQLAERKVAEGYSNVTRAGFDNVAFAAEDVTNGQMVAIVGGVDFFNKDFGENNYAHWRLPPGSSFKPYDYLSVIEHSDKFGAGSVLYDTQGVLDGYPCTNKANPKQGGNCLWDYDFRYPGPMTLRYALGGSRNVPAVKAMLTAGVDKTIETAEKLGLDSGYNCYAPGVADVNFAKESEQSQCYSSSAIGDGAYLMLDEHVHAYSTISRNGNKIPQTYILKIEDAGNKIVDEWKQEPGEQVVRPDSAYIVADMMADPNASYFTNKPHRYNGWEFSLKTGTTNDSKDGWLMGFSTKYAAGVWVGHHTREVATRSFMETMTQPIWQGWMNEAHNGLTPVKRERPAGIQELPAYIVRQHVGLGSREPSPAKDLFPSWYQQNKKKTNEKKTIDVVSNRLATDCTPSRARRESVENAGSFSSDQFINPGSNANTSEKDDIHQCSDAKPSITVTNTSSPCTSSCTIYIAATQGTHPLGGGSQYGGGVINVIIDGQVVQSFPATQTTLSFSYNGSSSKAVTVELVDSVLYDASTTTTVKFSSNGGGGDGESSISAISTALVGNDLTVSWTGGEGPFDVSIDDNEICSNVNGQSCTEDVSSYLGTGSVTISVKGKGTAKTKPITL